MWLQIIQSRPYFLIFGPKLGTLHMHGALGQHCVVFEEGGGFGRTSYLNVTMLRHWGFYSTAAWVS